MRVLFKYLSLATGCVLLASCASERTVSNKTSRSTEGLDKYNSNYEYTKDKNGLMRAQSGQRSQYESQVNHVSNRNFSGKNYSKNEFQASGWQGNSTYQSKKYQGKTDGSRFQHAPQFVQNQANYNKRFNGSKTSHYSGNQYAKGGTYNTGAAHVNRNPHHYGKDKTTLYSDPVILTPQQQSQLSVKETNSMLGR